ncbi:hypothetical protein RvY_01708-2 [Ramazzottius varieornatus]|uniref:Uncharacterized protein n=1 Tax=Ramazzottius varieornatus TaxID=947166 RepID=A0A1D1UHC2_RAMVA|nr:hypothetical protein RvY_01708-2 [Ramazzottius varieornatus]
MTDGDGELMDVGKQETSGPLEEPPDDHLVVKVFYSVLPGDTEPHPPPLLDCQLDGPGKVPLSIEGFETRHLFVIHIEQKYLLKRHKKPTKYIHQLLEQLLPSKAWDFVFSRREQWLKVNSRRKAIPLFRLFTNEFLHTLEAHMEEIGMPLSMKVIRKVIKTRNDYEKVRRARLTRNSRSSCPRSKRSPATGLFSDDEEDISLADESDDKEEMPMDSLTEEESSRDLLDEEENDVSDLPTVKKADPGRVFTIDTPSLACEEPESEEPESEEPESEEPESGKVALVRMDDEDFPGVLFYLDQKTLDGLQNDCARRGKNNYPRKIFAALLGIEGMCFLRERRMENQALFGGKTTFGDKCAEILFTQGFFDTIRGTPVVKVFPPDQ